MSTPPTPASRPFPALRAQALSKMYGSVTALDDVSFTVSRGEIVGLLGPNGAGKTTTINMVLGVLAATTGNVEIDGIDIAKHRARALARTNFAAVYAALPGNLTVMREPALLRAAIRHSDLRQRVDELLRSSIWSICGIPSAACFPPASRPAQLSPRHCSTSPQSAAAR